MSVEKDVTETIKDYKVAVDFLMGEIEGILTDGSDFDFEKAFPILSKVGVTLGNDYFAECDFSEYEV